MAKLSVKLSALISLIKKHITYNLTFCPNQDTSEIKKEMHYLVYKVTRYKGECEGVCETLYELLH